MQPLPDTALAFTVDSADPDGVTALHASAKHGSAGVAELLLRHGADASLRDATGMTPLLAAAFFGHYQVRLPACLRGGGGGHVLCLLLYMQGRC